MKLFESALDYDLCREILKEAQHGFEHNPKEWISSHTFWKEYIINDSRPVMIRKLGRKYYDVVLDQLTSKLILPVLPENMQYEVLSYMWPVTGNIPWHFDGDDRVTATLYLNEEWLKEWGGLFLYEENSAIKGLVPKFNSILVNDKNLCHTVTPVLSAAKTPRFTLQIFSYQKSSSDSSDKPRNY